MTVYVLNLLVGFNQNGIDNAQGYREKMFSQIGLDSKYVFTEFPDMRDIVLCKNVGIPVNKMINPHLKLTGRDCFKFTDDTESMIQVIKTNMNVSEIIYVDNNIQFWKGGYLECEIHVLPYDHRYFYEIIYFKENCLIKKDFYSSGIVYSEFFVTAENEKGSLYAKTVKRTFYETNGMICLEQIGDNYVLINGRMLNQYELLNMFFDLLKLTDKDTLLLDRAYNIKFNEVIFEKRLPCKKICVIHSGHYFEPYQCQYALYLSYEYYYWFKYAKYVDLFVVSTESQKIDLVKVLNNFKYDIPKIKVIPVGAIKNLCVTNDRKINSIITASRLVNEKRVDLIIKSVIKAHNTQNDISLDIYGDGDEDIKCELRKIVKDNNAESYIRFMGYQSLENVYKNYVLYISMSMFETFGLTLLEAAASGCALIGLDVPYGNATFIKEGYNGYLVDYSYNQSEESEIELVESVSERILKIVNDKEILNEFSKNSYVLANNFLLDKVAYKWEKTFNEM